MANKIVDKLKTQKVIKWFWIIIATPVACGFLLILLIGIGAFGKLPTFEELENPKSNLSTEIYSEDGVMIGSFHYENRSFVSYDDLSPALVVALVSTEDMRYYTHSGIDFISLARVAVKTIGMGRSGEGGGSTVTQQLAKNLYPRDTVVYRNPISRGGKLIVTKLKEWITAVMLERNYTKEEILTMYLNVVEFGSNAFGIKSAARTFFNKSPDELNIQESAMLIGVVNKPTGYSPVINPDRALNRRNLVLERMRSNGYLTRVQRDSILQLPIQLDYNPISHNSGTGTHFRQMLSKTMTMKRPVRSLHPDLNDFNFNLLVQEWDNNPLYGWCIKNTKADGTPYNIWRDGLKIYTTLNSVMQTYAEDALLGQMVQVQARMDRLVQSRNGRIFSHTLSKEDENAIMWRSVRNTDRYRMRWRNTDATREEVMKEFNTPVKMRVFTYQGDRDTILSPYDSIMHMKRHLWASFIALDPSTGYVKAYVGGSNFRYVKYDMVTQGRRQVGSTIKPFIYSFAIDQLGYNPCTMVPNLQYSIENATGVPWKPKEASNVEYHGELHPLRWGLAMSRNNYSAWIMKQAKEPQAVANYIHQLGIRSYIDPVQSLVLGPSDFTLYELVSAYGTFANRGVFFDPIFVTRIEDRQGNVLATFSAPATVAMSEQNAYTMLGMLKFVVSNGTASRLRGEYGIAGEVGGKTGTSQENSDAWFVAVTPKLVAGSWVGGEERSIHLNVQAEGSRLALPIVGQFLKDVYTDPGLEPSLEDQFPLPVGVINYDCPQESSDRPETYYEEDEFFN